jgi:restriction endonuclease Mrr
LSRTNSSKKEQDDLVERQKKAKEKLKANAAVREKLEQLKGRYMSLVTSTNPQTRGFELERVMYDLFELFDLDPKASFRNTGEQIDGAFSLASTDFLFEAKWRQEQTDAADLDSFASKVRRKLENTLGVFLSINGFTPTGIAAHSSGGAVIVLMDGADLMAVFEERIDFVTLLLRKKRHAAQTGEIYLPIHQIL